MPQGLFRLRRFDRDVGIVLAAFIVLLVLENLVVGLGWRSEFVGTWEMGSARLYLSPIALAVMFPVAVSTVLLAKLANANRPIAVGIVGGLWGAAVAFGVSNGRHLSSLFLRVPFIVVVAIAAGALIWFFAREMPTIRPILVMNFGLIVGCIAWMVDAFVLRRLYPAFHLGLFYIVLVGWSAPAMFVRRKKIGTAFAWGAILITGASIAWMPIAAVKVGPEDNLRRVLLENAPILGRSVILAARISPPPPLDDDDTAATATLTSLRHKPALPKADRLDWRGHDLVLITVDALRADHLSSYGYARKTTPNIDALAAKGVRFDNAYCPTPHTSYSIASMMTGKYMKPLLALGAEETSEETWSIYLRRYGYRTAAFYPPAVFFIDEHRFHRMRDENLGFEYYKEEFARPELRREQIEQYLASAPKDKPVFLWVHLFEPHEPYEMHPEFPYSDHPRVDAYDSEVSAADALVGDIQKLVEANRPPGAVTIVSADHGEEHGDHGGRYHGTTVYEEQVRVPLIIVAPHLAPRVVKTPVQTIDLLPTTLSALDVPIPPRLRGRDLGAALAGTEAPNEEGLAFSETDDYTLVARGTDRLVCARKIGSCTLFDVAKDREQKQPVADRPARVTELRKLTAAIERETGKHEASGLPEALRRGLQGDRDAAEDVAPLLDDAKVDIRRLAARCAYSLKAPEMSAQLRRTMNRDEDGEVRRWCALAIVRLGEKEQTAQAIVDSILKTGNAEEKAAAALALGERGDVRAEPELVARWNAAFGADSQFPGELDEARELLAAFSKLRSKQAVLPLTRSLEDVRLRPYVVETLTDIGDPRAKAPILRVFAEERYVHLRPLEAHALQRLGGTKAELAAPLTRFAGTPEPMAEAILVARDLKMLTPDKGGREWPATPPVLTVDVKLRVAQRGEYRLLVISEGNLVDGTINGSPLTPTGKGPPPGEASLPPVTTVQSSRIFVGEAGEIGPGEALVHVNGLGPIRAVWLVPHAAEIPPPPPRVWVPKSNENSSDGGL